MQSIVEQVEEITGLSNLSDDEALEILGLRNFKKKKLVNNALDILEEDYEETERDGDGLFAYIDDFLDDYSKLKSPFKWREIKRQDIIGLTEYIVDENLNMGDVTDLLDINPKRPVRFEALEDSLYDLADEFSEDDDSDFEDDIDLDGEADDLFTEIDNFLDDYSELKSPFKWKAIDQKEIVDLTERIVDEDLNMRDVTELLDINPKRPIRFEALEDSLYDLADEFSEDEDSDFEDDIDLDGEADDLISEIDNFLDDYSDLKSPFKWRAVDQKDIIDLTEYIMDEDLSMRDVTELLDINPKRPIKFEALKDSLYSLAYTAVEFEDGDEFDDDYEYDDEDYYAGDYDDDYDFEEDFESDFNDEFEDDYEDDFVDYYNDEEDYDFDDEDDDELEDDYEYEYEYEYEFEGADVAFKTIDPITNYAESRESNSHSADTCVNSFTEQMIDLNDSRVPFNPWESAGDCFITSSHDPQVATLINEQLV